jgi:PAS domain S-box-containing protein
LLGIKEQLERVQGKLERAERALESLSRILTLIPDPIEVVSADNSILFANRASRLLHENEQLEGSLYYQSVMGLEQPPENCPIHRAVEDDREAAYTAACENGDVFEVTVTPIVLSDGRRAAMCLSKLKPAETGGMETSQPETLGLSNEDGVPNVDDVSLEELHAAAVGLIDSGASASDGESADAPEDDEQQLFQQIAELSTQTLDVVLDQISDGVMMIDSRGKLILTNAAFRQMVALDDAGESGADLSSLISLPEGESGASPAATLADLTAAGGTAHSVATVVRGDGERVAVDLAVSRVPGEMDDEEVILVTVRDLRKTNQLKDQLVKALNFSLTAERIATLAHQVNNCLTPALYHTDMLVQQSDRDRKTQRSVAKIQNYLNSSHESMSMVLSLTRPAVESEINVNHLIGELFSRHYFADQLQKDNIEVVQRYDTGMVETTGYRVLLQQALANIIKNAQEAMVRANDGGRLMVLTEATPSSITIHIGDDGPGIPKEKQQKIFDLQPASSALGKGSGVGLFFSREVITRHDGTIEVKSRPGEGTTFIIRLPVRESDVTPSFETGSSSPATVFADMATVDSPPREALDEPSTGRILVIDDEPAILELLTGILSADGHTVVTSLDSIDALKKIRSDRFDCVVCDVRMPDIKAPELSRIIEQHDSELSRHLVFIIGDILNRETASCIQKTGVPCIEKPFVEDRVREVVCDVLSPRGN